jgi:two-component system response regulator HydG
MPIAETDTSDRSKASRQRLLDMIHFDQDTGSISFAGQRMLMIHEQAFSLLRSQMIEALGIDRTREIIFQMGYMAGTLDGESIKRIRSGLDPLDAFMLGPDFFRTEGFGAIDVLRFVLDASEHRSEFLWENSPEADMHIKAFGVGEAPACWFATGYASGCGSSLLDTPLIVREVECRATGHAQCRCVSEPADDTHYSTLSRASIFSRRLQEQPPHNLLPGHERAKNAGTNGASIVGSSKPFVETLDQISRVAVTNATVLLLGESGVGKSLLAREVHKASKRSAKPFIEINCAAIPEQILEAELFGVEAGAFTGATKSRDGRFQIADGGTLFLDEIALLPLTAQGKLLRVLQTGEFERLGSNTTLRVDLRVVAATNSDLRQRVQEGSFRGDLYYRVAVFPVEVPPLRTRKDDIPSLLQQCLRKFAASHGRKVPEITPSALQALRSYAWPGNVREFENVLERALILASDGGPIDLQQLSGSGVIPDHDMVQASPRPPQITLPPRDDALVPHILSILDLHVSWADIERTLITTAVQRAGGNVSRAAVLLGMTRPQLAYRLRSLQ